ncbi:hypothetical protein M758_4G177400 [Ceratodon purpureus]|nr:hypothetical protein M758_4G177400 [Ceratodon purpureus]
MDEAKKNKNGRPSAVSAAAITKNMLLSVQKISKLHGFKISVPSLKKSTKNKGKEGDFQSGASSSGSRSPKSISTQQSNKDNNFERIPNEVFEDDVSKNLPTRIGRYRVWHPKESIVKEPPGFRVPPIEELEEMYNMPVRRLRPREDGVGGATLWQPYEPVPPIGIEAAIAKNLEIQNEKDINVSYTHLGKWRDVLRDPVEVENEKKSKKRSLR